ncbi:protein kinase family protein [Parendozoicomonas haliclonae]|uniref:mitogen-activated protein kinase kinase n=1 Tax=Parendozoicomonas haliclonae TaxID=1960125 RepID=A0A1X7AG40_9GAMM|nr:protein kinase family protein [Parendozoicomonas haliclonae]SMA38973.1 Serine/threonine-protein kinase PrkC [Parendozoicomonas haliclonae]
MMVQRHSTGETSPTTGQKTCSNSFKTPKKGALELVVEGYFKDHPVTLLAQPQQWLILRDAGKEIGLSQSQRRDTIHYACHEAPVLRNLGRGSFANVQQIPSRQVSGTTLALKTSQRDDSRPVIFWGSLKEARLGIRLDHLNLVKVFGYEANNSSVKLVMAFYPQSLDTLLKTGRLDADTRQSIASDTMEGLLFLHSMNILHNDLKPANILIDRNGVACLADLGMCCAVDKPDSIAQAIHYMAPELSFPKTGSQQPGETPGAHNPHSITSDIFGLGFVLACVYGNFSYLKAWAINPYSGELVILLPLPEALPRSDRQGQAVAQNLIIPALHPAPKARPQSVLIMKAVFGYIYPPESAKKQQ